MKKKSFTIRLTEEEIAALKKQASDLNRDMTEHIKLELGLRVKKDGLTIDEVLRRINGKKPEGSFSINSLFTTEEWESFSTGNRIAIGRLIARDPEKFGLIYLGKNSANLSRYKIES